MMDYELYIRHLWQHTGVSQAARYFAILRGSISERYRRRRLVYPSPSTMRSLASFRLEEERGQALWNIRRILPCTSGTIAEENWLRRMSARDLKDPRVGHQVQSERADGVM